MGSLWGKECVQDDPATVIVPVFEWVKCFDVINRTMQQSWRGESVQSHVITQAGGDVFHYQYAWIPNSQAACVLGFQICTGKNLPAILVLIYIFTTQRRQLVLLTVGCIGFVGRQLNEHSLHWQPPTIYIPYLHNLAVFVILYFCI